MNRFLYYCFHYITALRGVSTPLFVITPCFPSLTQEQFRAILITGSFNGYYYITLYASSPADPAGDGVFSYTLLIPASGLLYSHSGIVQKHQ